MALTGSSNAQALMLAAAEHFEKNTLPGHYAVAYLVVDGAMFMALFAYFRDLEDGCRTDAEFLSYFLLLVVRIRPVSVSFFLNFALSTACGIGDADDYMPIHPQLDVIVNN
ncbi:MAG: hypothetical protein Q7R35_06475 [Elusimicrobiota bacterium]|nr:hypothetical protein [Elusimicrobiota bacterium]